MTIDDFPVIGDKLIRSDLPDFKNNVCLHYLHSENGKWINYIDGYKDAANILAKHIAENHTTIDTVFFPLAYLFRHHVELTLKTIILIGCKLTPMEKSDHYIHNLHDLWIRARSHIEIVWKNSDQEILLNNVAKIIEEFNSIDKSCTAFRYPFDKKNQESLDGTTHINIINFCEVANKLCNFLDSCVAGMENLLDEKLSYQAEIQKYYN